MKPHSNAIIIHVLNLEIRSKADPVQRVFDSFTDAPRLIFSSLITSQPLLAAPRSWPAVIEGFLSAPQVLPFCFVRLIHPMMDQLVVPTTYAVQCPQ